jgi:hypothetical protein
MTTSSTSTGTPSFPSGNLIGTEFSPYDNSLTLEVSTWAPAAMSSVATRPTTSPRVPKASACISSGDMNFTRSMSEVMDVPAGIASGACTTATLPLPPPAPPPPFLTATKATMAAMVARSTPR